MIAAQGKRIDYLDKKINENSKKIKRSAAQSAALTGLFQPYNVGKFSASVAVGGFSDQQAVAIGAGYRFNENVAAKTGIAFSEKDSSWNMGINFEF
ncbi:adhesin [Salmonella enterica subsp. enterica serovar Enteritidis]|nr:adhesin [Salmonella enterica subsp. enterica serovar Enteritidis]